MQFINDEKYKIFFLDNKTNWRYKLAEVKKYINKNEKRPSIYNKNNEIKNLARWTYHQQENSKNRTQIMKEDDIYNEWLQFINDEKYKIYFDIDNIRDWKNKLQEVKIYIEKNNKRPSCEDKNKKLKILGVWCIMQQKNSKIRKQIMKEDDIYNEWMEFINDEKYIKYFLDNKTDWRYKLEEIKKYIDKNNKRPSCKDINKEVKQLGLWLITQQKNSKIKKHIMKKYDIFIEWILFINNPKYSKYFDKGYILSLGTREKNIMETLENLTNKINVLRDKLPDLIINKNIDNYIEQFNTINYELIELENIRNNIYTLFINYCLNNYLK
jgi:hypothetical protein